jgi:DNA (cytosine-5)-methyltransferase 1
MQGGNKQPKIRVPEANAKGYAEATVGDSINLKNINSKTRRGRVGKGIAKTLETRQEQYTVQPVITPDRVNKSQNGRRIKEAGDPAFTVTATDRHGVLISKTIRVGGRNSPHGSKQNWDSYEIDGVIRRLTPLECERLQAFPDNWTKLATIDCTKDNCDRCSLLAEIGNGDIHTIPVEMSDTQRYKMCGNAVTTNVIQAVFERILVS